LTQNRHEEEFTGLLAPDDASCNANYGASPLEEDGSESDFSPCLDEEYPTCVGGKCKDVVEEGTRPVVRSTGTGIHLELCDGTTAQQWEFNEDGNLMNLFSHMCVQFTTDADARCRKNTADSFPGSSHHNVFGSNDEVEIAMFPCDDTSFAWARKHETATGWDSDVCDEDWMKADLTMFNPEFYKEVEHNITHGAYWYDMTEGVTMAQNVLEFHKDSENINSISNFDVTNKSAITMVIAGNTTVTVKGDDCAEEGCAPPNLLGDSDNFDTFFWSNDLGWNRTGDPAVDVPGFLSKVTIINVWTVILDVTTDILDHLEIRGTLCSYNGNEIRVTLNTFYIDIRGGSLLIGNSTHPYTGAGITISMHGDPYVHGNSCNKYPKFSSEFEEAHFRGFMIGCGKRMDVNGELAIYGKPRHTQSVLDGNHGAGATTLKVRRSDSKNVTPPSYITKYL